MSWLSEKWYDRWPLNQPTNQPTKPLQQLSCLAHSQAPLEEQFLYYGLFYFLFLSTLACSCLTDINFLITNTSPSFDIYMTFCPAVCNFSSPEFWQIVMEIHLHKPSSNFSHLCEWQWHCNLTCQHAKDIYNCLQWEMSIMMTTCFIPFLINCWSLSLKPLKTPGPSLSCVMMTV